MREKRPLREDGRIDYTKRGRPRGRPANTKHSADEDSIKVDSAPEDSETSPASVSTTLPPLDSLVYFLSFSSTLRCALQRKLHFNGN